MLCCPIGISCLCALSLCAFLVSGRAVLRNGAVHTASCSDGIKERKGKHFAFAETESQ